MIKQLWQKRLTTHLRTQSKYLRLVFNEYFLLALIFLIGAIGYWYAQGLQQIKPHTWWCLPLALLILALVVGCFSLVTLIEAADLTFLLAQEKQFRSYLKQARNYSLILPTGALILSCFFVTPLLALGGQFTPGKVVCLALGLLVCEAAILTNAISACYGSQAWGLIIEKWLGLVIFLGVSAYCSVILGLVGTILWLIGSEKRRRRASQQVLQWQYLLNQENQRSYRVKRFYNLFTDVPDLNSKVVRRSWLDWCLKPIKLKSENTYLYLLARGFLRNSEYSNLYARLLVIELCLAAAMHNALFLSLIMSLFLYLVEFQLVPLYRHYDHHPLLQIYPLTSGQKKVNFQKLLTNLLTVQWLLGGIVVVIFQNSLSAIGLPLVISGIVGIILVMWVLPRQLQKLKHS
ncbi:ABC transporter permease [Lactobacillus sp. DCY120]|uniref:ABC transporter permease n=1 Tax=Bombilactobacillus apium TaxID=2675299 RepID=A0A850R846_9LACO|nr:ABC transporter permease [Bombilactobacillus apium]NVY96882.1 ABC transporter permease [Bombilactobacillus apium]